MTKEENNMMTVHIDIKSPSGKGCRNRPKGMTQQEYFDSLVKEPEMSNREKAINETNNHIKKMCFFLPELEEYFSILGKITIRQLINKNINFDGEYSPISDEEYEKLRKYKTSIRKSSDNIIKVLDTPTEIICENYVSSMIPEIRILNPRI